MDALLDTVQAMELQRKIVTKPSYFLDTLFPRKIVFDTTKIMFDQVADDRRIAPFVSPLVEGVVMTNNGHTTKEFEPAYVKPSHTLRPSDTKTRMPGEPIGGSWSPTRRKNMKIGENLKKERDAISRREEVMASEIARTGKVTVSGENTSPVVVDFGRNAGHTVTLAPGSQWGEAGVSIVENLKSWFKTVALNGGGRVTRVTVEASVLDIMLADAEVKALLDLHVAGQVVDIKRDISSEIGANYYGKLNAYCELWVYDDYYEDESQTLVALMPTGTVVLSTDRVNGAKCYGMIEDFDGIDASDVFSKIIKKDDPSVIKTVTQSAPLPVLGNIDGTFCATVF